MLLSALTTLIKLTKSTTINNNQQQYKKRIQEEMDTRTNLSTAEMNPNEEIDLLNLLKVLWQKIRIGNASPA